ncbi:cyclin domain-containing protein [Colletotrichum lupini]|uniref:Cyclin domain-containing protein n=1 Tax=Colletotrichum lupini TaxID=145971 RepID=A0A9Q8WAI4_9PEZI|nr:cyclin domain-containing protein [Colletotrichum lupini]KAK1708365.1 cyclin domain-containing protein [Colletotrichum lupini]UQC76086.1 cyclin domain-containing protein [Colletotrichum lupini]
MAHMTNTLATAEQLYKRNSFSSLPADLQDVIFYATQCLTQAAGVLLDLPQSTTAQANVLLARYWLVESPMAGEFSDVSAAALYLVAKMGPVPRSTRDVSNVYAYLLSPASTLFRGEPPDDDPKKRPRPDPTTYYQTEGEYAAFQTRMLAAEARVLWALGFDTAVALPHALAVTYLQALDFLGKPRAQVAGRVVAHLNTALLSPQMLYLTHQPNALATAAVYIAAREAGAKMPEVAWWEVFDVEREELGFLVVGMRSLEGWVRGVKETGMLAGGMITRVGIEREARRRAGEGDEEDEIMALMDQKAA